MTPRQGEEEWLGAGVVAILLRQRRPMVMVDFVASFRRGPVPTLRAGRHISANEVFFDGHFPGFPVWPAALTMEGLGQGTAILMALLDLARKAEEAGADADAVIEGLRNLDRGFRLHSGYRPDAASPLLQELRRGGVPLGVAASVNLKFLRPVFPGCRLDYTVALTDTVGATVRFAVEASVGPDLVAKGSLSGARVTTSPPSL